MIILGLLILVFAGCCYVYGFFLLFKELKSRHNYKQGQKAHNKIVDKILL